ncbi:MAG: c-type cytochrome [Caldilineae bacterium]|nr:c-type cytochrome [Chloroflexota bacterium]MCB9176347.1 c-type cytochrome [Caldilineae bacterium]
MKQERRDVVRDHDFDGIQEFDNQLPRWWLGTFVLTILLALYWWGARETFGTEPSIREIHAQQWAELQALQLEKGGAPPTAEEVEAALADPEALAAGKAVFESTCFACHGSLGEGNIGPNLTDAYWLHGSRPEQIGLTIFQGVPEKGMPTWRGALSAEKIQQVAAYVISLQGSEPPNPKAPQGTQEP